MNYAQLTNLFRVEERSVQFVIASVANILITVGVTVLLVVGLHKGAPGAVVGNFVGTLAVYLVLLGYRRYQLGLRFDRRLFREMNRFGLPLVPSALALWAINFIDRIFIAQYKGQSEVGVYSVAVRISSAIVFLMMAFRLAWPAFAYSIEDDRQAKRTYSFVLTYLLFLCTWVSLALGLLSPWLVRLLARGPGFQRASEAVALLAFGSAAYAGYTVLAIGVGRARAAACAPLGRAPRRARSRDRLPRPGRRRACAAGRAASPVDDRAAAVDDRAASADRDDRTAAVDDRTASADRDDRTERAHVHR